MTPPIADSPGVVAPPVAIYAVGIVGGFALDYFFPYPLLPGWVQYPLGALLLVPGAAVIWLAYRKFRRAKTDVRPWKPTTAIVADGIYRYTRNPIYLGFTLLQAGAGVAGDSPWVLAMLGPVLWVMHHGVILDEERYLEVKFCEAYLDYKATVRRWV
jgi:protein-S-isoprenylcysteine O-methyltransferase Ste14